MIIQLTQLGGSHLYASTSCIFAGADDSYRASGQNTGVWDGGESPFYVTETPEQIAALVAAAKREARIRNLAEQTLLADVAHFGDAKGSVMDYLAKAAEVVDAQDKFFAARSAAKTGEE